VLENGPQLVPKKKTENGPQYMVLRCISVNSHLWQIINTWTFENTVGWTKKPFEPNLPPPHSSVALLSIPDFIYLSTFSNCFESICDYMQGPQNSVMLLNCSMIKNVLFCQTLAFLMKRIVK